MLPVNEPEIRAAKWEISHSVNTAVSISFAWAYMADVANWNDPPATFELNGPFVAGSRGITRIPGQEPRHWQLVEVNPMSLYVLETALDRAAMSFEWRFDFVSKNQTRLTQHIILGGENASAYVEQVKSVFAVNLAPGMKRIAAAMEQSHQIDL
jgi:hypothetical protein